MNASVQPKLDFSKENVMGYIENVLFTTLKTKINSFLEKKGLISKTDEVLNLKIFYFVLIKYLKTIHQGVTFNKLFKIEAFQKDVFKLSVNEKNMVMSKLKPASNQKKKGNKTKKGKQPQNKKPTTSTFSSIQLSRQNLAWIHVWLIINNIV